MASSAAAAAAAAASPLIDHADADISTQPSLAALDGACRRAIGRQIRWQASLRDPIGGGSTLPLIGEFEREESLDWADGGVVDGVSDAPSTTRLIIAYLIMGHRPFAHLTIGRLIATLGDPAHLFLVHLDGRTNASTVNELHRRLDTLSNVRFMRPRRAVG